MTLAALVTKYGRTCADIARIRAQSAHCTWSASRSCWNMLLRWTIRDARNLRAEIMGEEQWQLEQQRTEATA